MHAHVTRQIFQLVRQCKEFFHFLFTFVTLLQLRFGRQRLGQRYRPVLHHRNQLRQLVAEVVRQIQHTTRITDDGLGRHGAEGRDLRHGIGAILLAHVFDHLPAIVLTEIDIEVGHRHPFRVQEAFEEQGIGKRIEVGNTQRVRHQRTGT